MTWLLLHMLFAYTCAGEPAGDRNVCNAEDACEPGLSLLQKQAAAAVPPSPGLTLASLLLAELEHSTAELGQTACGQEDVGAKDLDIIIYGATGFTGQLATKYLARGLPDKPRWAIAGRHRDELLKLKAEVAPDGVWPVVLVADLQDEASLREMTRRARSVLTFAGPYEAYGGANLIRAAVSTCTHYADLCGEGPWKVRMLAEFGDAAKARGMAIVQSIGLDALPADLLALRSAELLAADGLGPASDVTVLWSKLNGYVSGGTVASGRNAMREGALLPGKATAYALAPELPEEARVDSLAGGLPLHVGGRSPVGFDPYLKTMTVPYSMGFIDGQVVRRSLGLAFPGAPIHFAEVMGESAFTERRKFKMDPMMKIDPPARVPQKGQGPPEWVQEKGSLAGQGFAMRGPPHAAQARLYMECNGDPGYAATAKWSVELVVGLALNGPKDGQGGYLTPATALGAQPLMDRLTRADGGKLCKFSTSPFA